MSSPFSFPQTKPNHLFSARSKLRERKKEQDMPSMNSTLFTSMRDQVVNLFKELSENINKFSTLLFALITSTNSLFMKQNKQMIFLVWTIVLYSFLVIIGTILQIHNRSLLPIIICAMLIVGGAASFLALSIISLTVAIITLVLWVGIFTFVVYKYVVAQRRSELLPP